MPRTAPPTLLLTRPQADSRRFARLLPEFPVVISPLLRIVAVPHDADRLHAAPGLVFTSVHAVAAAGPGAGRLALCVGGRTARTARRAGFEVREGQDGTASGLLRPIAAADRTLLHPHGQHLAQTLPVAGMVVYDQVAQPLDAAATALLAGTGPVILPLFSQRSARLASEAVRQSRAPLWPVAISAAAMSAWDASRAGSTVAASPTAEAIAAAIRSLEIVEQS